MKLGLWKVWFLQYPPVSVLAHSLAEAIQYATKEMESRRIAAAPLPEVWAVRLKRTDFLLGPCMVAHTEPPSDEEIRQASADPSGG
jgi:hypothetical protein